MHFNVISHQEGKHKSATVAQNCNHNTQEAEINKIIMQPQTIQSSEVGKGIFKERFNLRSKECLFLGVKTIGNFSLFFFFSDFSFYLLQ